MCFIQVCLCLFESCFRIGRETVSRLFVVVGRSVRAREIGMVTPFTRETNILVGGTCTPWLILVILFRK